MRTHALAFLATAALSGTAMAGSTPWPGDRWRADVDVVENGHRRHAVLLGTETHTERGTRVALTCTDRNLSTGTMVTSRGTAFALMRQDDWEGDAGRLGTFGSSGSDLRWFGPSPCPSGRIEWKRN